MHSMEVSYSEQLYTLVSGEEGRGGGGATPGNSYWDVLPGFPNPDPNSDQKKAIFNAYPFLELA